jgi:hypothetical protein
MTYSLGFRAGLRWPAGVPTGLRSASRSALAVTFTRIAGWCVAQRSRVRVYQQLSIRKRKSTENIASP